MRKLLSLGFLLAVSVCGCSPHEALVPGRWSVEGLTLDAKDDHTYVVHEGEYKPSGTWSIDGDDVTFTPTAVNGQEISIFKGFLEKKVVGRGEEAKEFADYIDTPNVFKLASDGKTMTTDKAKDTNPGPGATLTKG